MERGPELEIGGDLFRAFVAVLGAMPATLEPVVVVSLYLFRLAKGYGLSERVDEDPLARAAVAEPARALVAHFLHESESTNADALRDRLCTVFVEISRDTEALRILNKNGQLGAVEMLKAAQIYWNLEADDEKAQLLPIRPGQKITAKGTAALAAIKVPNANKDFATMTWAARITQKNAHRSSGQGFRDLGARLAVLAARLIVAGASQNPPSLGDAVLVLDPTGKRASISWPDTNRVSAAPAAALAEHLRAVADHPSSVVPDQPSASPWLCPAPAQVIVGSFAQVGSSYQRRGFDDEIDRLWAEGGDRRVWLRGGPGLGKSCTARRVIQDALARRGDDREDLLIWVDSADPQSVRQAFSSAVDRMPQLGVSVAPQASEIVDLKARALLEALGHSPWRWLIVLDNADARGLIEAELIPSGGNTNGRVLITTLSRDQRITGNGRIVTAELFTPPEAEAFLRAQLDPANGRPAALARSSLADTAALAAAVGYHPLALSIAAATIVANTMDVAEWITEFRTAEEMDAAADARDAGGYPHLIGATWRLALDKASQGLPDGVVERAAMVAGVQDPDGHPTWLWDGDTVAGWVGGGSALARRHGVPVVVQRLIDHGIIEMRGGTWRGGKLAIHQLAARALRELASAEDLASLADILVNQWLLHLTEDESGTRPALRRNIDPLTALPGLSIPTDQATRALLGYAPPPSARFHAWMTTRMEGAAAYLAKGGTTGQALMAEEFTTRGDEAGELGLLDEARARRTQAAQLYELVVASPSLDDGDRADHLYELGTLHEKLGHADRAREVFTRALTLREQLLDVGTEGFSDLIRMAELHKALGNREALVAVTERVAGAIDAMTDLELAEAMRDPSGLLRWEGRAEDLRRLGLLDRATRTQALIVEASQQSRGWGESDALRKLALIRAEAGQWGDAEDVLARVTTEQVNGSDNLVLLASIQMHLGRMDDAEKNVERAAKVYRSRDLDRPMTALDSPLGDLDVVGHWLVMAETKALRRERWDDVAGLSAGLVGYHGKHADHDPGEHEDDLARANFVLGVAKLQNGQPGQAVDPLARAVNVFQMLTDLKPDDQAAQSSLALALTFLARAHSRLRQRDEAVDLHARAMNILHALPDPEAEVHWAQNASAERLSNLRSVSVELGKLEDAAYCSARLVGVRSMTVKLTPGSASARRDLASAEGALGWVELKLGRLDSAESWLASAVGRRQRLADLAPDDRDAQGELAQALDLLGIAHLQLERTAEAVHNLTGAVEIRRTLADVDPDDRDAQKYLASDLHLLGGVYGTVDRFEEAVECLTGATNVFQLLVDLAPGNPEPEVVKNTIQALTDLADVLRSLGRLDEVETATARAEELARRFPDPDPGR